MRFDMVKEQTMTVTEAIAMIDDCVRRMNGLYGRTLFDEWAVVSLLPGESKVLSYQGARRGEFSKNFASDAGELRVALVRGEHQFGDFEFARDAAGTLFDAFMCLGEGVYLIANNTAETMTKLTADPKWLTAQRAFVELSEHVRSHPVAHLR